MNYFSTNKTSPTVSAKTAILNGLAPDGGLYMPERIPQLPQKVLDSLKQFSLAEIGFEIARLFITDIPETDLEQIVSSAIDFDAPLVKLNSQMGILELFHGPSLAFKDFGARFMAGTMSYYLRDSKNPVTVLVATSGDTGSAVAHGFFKTPGINVVILYPSGKVSDLQEKQLTTLGENITALEVQGTFDDCQRLVKAAFVDKEITKNRQLASANSINVARLIPQSFYYFHAYNQVPDGKQVVFSIPSGNFGNLTAGLFAKRMGLPVEKFIASTNSNDVVPKYLETGIYNPQPSVSTISNAMDVGAPSNFARMKELYQDNLENFCKEITGCSFTDTETISGMKEVFQTFAYTLDPHGAVGYLGLKEYLNESSTNAFGIILETAHPAKFLDVVEDAIKSKVSIPKRLADCATKTKNAKLITSNFEEFKNLLRE
jgi:threonine synthase